MEHLILAVGTQVVLLASPGRTKEELSSTALRQGPLQEKKFIDGRGLSAELSEKLLRCPCFCPLSLDLGL